MKKKVVLKGTLCDICGRVFNPWEIETVYSTQHGTFQRCAKKLVVRLYSSFWFKTESEYFDWGNIDHRKCVVCPKCAWAFEEMFCQWKQRCKAEGKKERERMKLNLMEDESDEEETRH